MKSEAEVRAAIEQCLDECCRAASAVVKLAECIERLQAQGWEQAEVRQVEVPVLRMLSRLLSPNGDPDATEQADVEE